MSNINTLKSLNEKKNKSSNSSDDEGQQAFYAGGSNTSGQQVLGPLSKKKNQDEIIGDVFKSALNCGAQVIDPSSDSPKPKINLFPGTGFRLDSSPGQSSAKIFDSKKDNLNDKTTIRKLKMWKNGFSIDDGELRNYDDSENAEFLECIKRGEVPHELLKDTRSNQISLHLEDHRKIENDAIKITKIKPFSGEGQRLGNLTADFITNNEPLSPNSEKENEEKAKKVLNTDLSKPTTKIQVRLIDGTKLVVIMNLTHSINDLRLYIVNSRPFYAVTAFILCTSFPPKELLNEKLTIEESNLQGAVVIQKLQ